jgi:hypothetical protein
MNMNMTPIHIRGHIIHILRINCFPGPFEIILQYYRKAQASIDTTDHRGTVLFEAIQP